MKQQRWGRLLRRKVSAQASGKGFHMEGVSWCRVSEHGEGEEADTKQGHCGPSRLLSQCCPGYSGISDLRANNNHNS